MKKILILLLMIPALAAAQEFQTDRPGFTQSPKIVESIQLEAGSTITDGVLVSNALFRFPASDQIEARIRLSKGGELGMKFTLFPKPVKGFDFSLLPQILLSTDDEPLMTLKLAWSHSTKNNYMLSGNFDLSTNESASVRLSKSLMMGFWAYGELYHTNGAPNYGGGIIKILNKRIQFDFSLDKIVYDKWSWNMGFSVR